MVEQLLGLPPAPPGGPIAPLDAPFPGPPGMGPPMPPPGPPMPGGMGPPPGMPPEMMAALMGAPPEPEMPDAPPRQREEKKTARLRPFELKEPKRPAKKTKEWIMEEKDRRATYWKGRNEEINADLKYYLMDTADEAKTTGKGGEEDLHRVTGRAIIDKIANMVDRQRDRIECPARSMSQEYADAAQDVEDWLYDWREHLTDYNAMKLNQNYNRAEAWFAAACGWIMSRTCLKPGAEMPVIGELYDPRCCYPGVGVDASEQDGQLLDMLYVETTDKTTFLGANPKFKDRAALKSLKSDDKVEVVQYEDAFYKIVIVNDERVTRGEEEETEYGFCPWLAVPISGSPLWDQAHRRHHGAGALRAMRHVMAYENRFYSQLASVIARSANPPSVMEYDSSLGGAPKPIDLRPGARNALDRAKGKSYQPIQAMERPDQTQAMMDYIAEEVSRGGIEAMLLGGNRVPPNTGFQFQVMRFNAEDILQPITRGVTTHRKLQHKLALMLLLVAEKQGLLDPETKGEPDEEPTSGVRYRTRRPASGAGASYGAPGKKQGQVYSVLTAESIHLHGLANDIHLSNMTPQDMTQMAQTAALLIGQKIISRWRVWTEILNIDDPEMENWRLMYESTLIEDPDVVKRLGRDVAVEIFNPELAEWMRENPAPPPAGGPPMRLPPGGPPMPGAGVPAEMVPPPMQPGMGMPGAGDAGAVEAMLGALPQGLPPGGPF